MLVQEQNQVQKPIYFVSKALQGPELRYQSLEKGGASSSILSTKAPPLFPQLHGGGDDKPPYPKGTSKARCSREDGSLGGGAVGV